MYSDRDVPHDVNAVPSQMSLFGMIHLALSLTQLLRMRGKIHRIALEEALSYS